MKKIVSESLNQFLNEEINLPKAGELINKLLKNYKFGKFEIDDVQKRPDVYSKIKKAYEEGNGSLPNGLQGAAVIMIRSDKSGAAIDLISMEKALIKQMMNIVDKNFDKISTSEKEDYGHMKKDGWNEVETNKGSKGSTVSRKTGIGPEPNLTWKNKEGKQQAVYKGEIFLY